MKGIRAALLIAFIAPAAAAHGQSPPAQIDPFVSSELAAGAPILVHASGERYRATSARGSGRGPVVYGREVGGWRQYWVWFDLNTQDRGILRSGRHAGDWEMVQYRDDLAVYAQHAGAERCASTERRHGRPVVYVAEGSHASYFHAGARDRMWPDPNDLADGRGLVERPRVAPVEEQPWIDDPRPWGGARAGWFPAEQSSPRGPAFQGERWDDPDAWAAGARPCTGRRCTEIGACDGHEKAMSAGLVAAPLLLAGGFALRRRRRARR